jgi:hypothetical protein
VKRTCPKGEEGQRWKRGGDCKAVVAPGVSLDGVRRSEKAEVPEKTGAETSALSLSPSLFGLLFLWLE